MKFQENHRISKIFKLFSIILKLGYICPFQFFRQNITKIRVTKLDLWLYYKSDSRRIPEIRMNTDYCSLNPRWCQYMSLWGHFDEGFWYGRNLTSWTKLPGIVDTSLKQTWAQNFFLEKFALCSYERFFNSFHFSKLIEFLTI